MITIKELSELVERKSQLDQEEKLRKEYELRRKYEKEYNDAIEGLEQRLIHSARNGQNRLSVAHFSAFFEYNISKNLKKKRDKIMVIIMLHGINLFSKKMLLKTCKVI